MIYSFNGNTKREVIILSKNTRFYKLLLLILCILLIFSASACSAQKKPTPSTGQSSQSEKKAPKELDKLKESISKIEKTLEDMYEESKKPLFALKEQIEQAQNKGTSSSGGGGSSSGGGGSSGGGSGSSGGSGGSSSGSQGASPSPSPSASPSPTPMTTEEVKLKLEQEKFKKFETIKKDVLDLHSMWNSYEPKAISDLVPQAPVKEFETALEALTKAVDTRDVYASLLQINQLTKYLPDFYSLYQSKVPPDLDRLRFATKKIQLLSDKNDFEAAKAVLKYLEDAWATAKPKFKKDYLDEMNQFEFALSDFKSACDAKNNMMIEAKSKVLLKILDDIEKKAKK